MEFFMAGFYEYNIAEELIKSLDTAVGCTTSLLPEEVITGIIDWLCPMIVSSIDYPSLFSVMRRTLENLVRHSKQYLNELVNVSFLSILGNNFDPNLSNNRALVSDAIMGIRLLRRYAPDHLMSAINDAVAAIGFTTEESTRFNEITNMRPSKATDEKLTQLLQQVWKHSFRTYA
ncbi:hypothetical protein TVAG_029590 [Trichomonas vaginalis G3]|uniref:Uncharacterized protein n=1 Tax=Trichomonas vaginalis (strain ATCC PRA-98 / G3) TaxID=412133 RepID=A2FKJ3_TRIV3|nr:uncharacterized protein TVAGG3_1077490 [Trichomonas vaginalis G3]EAX94566.1 hypothetical protein TVAG_029590 [Trichomonas vaginalis G3]KAI5482790.1 hypothetical protein TVAGG3_1077490 [Trichomonas vaginalis G3]|eukprot:XP_001307496.1 hypothetical protein [Trichomonas vaginalis G3]